MNLFYKSELMPNFEDVQLLICEVPLDFKITKARDLFDYLETRLMKLIIDEEKTVRMMYDSLGIEDFWISGKKDIANCLLKSIYYGKVFSGLDTRIEKPISDPDEILTTEEVEQVYCETTIEHVIMLLNESY